jgi:plasmid stabilization system protein ParE
MRRFELTSDAQRDLEAIAEYIAVEATVDQAMRVVTELRDAFRMLGEMPGMGHFREDLLDRHYKFWSVHS